MAKRGIYRYLLDHRLPIGVVSVLAVLWAFVLQINNVRITPYKPVAWATIAIVFIILISLSCWIFLKSIRYIWQRAGQLKPALALIEIFFIWSLTELAVAWAVAFIWIGRNGSPDTLLPFGSLAPLLALTPLRFLGRLVGFFGLSAAVVTAGFAAAHPKLRRLLPAYLGLVIILTLVAWLGWRQPTGPRLQAIISAEDLGNPKVVPVKSAQLVVLPEYGLDNYADNSASRFQTDHPIWFVGSYQQPIRTGHYNTLLVGSSERIISAQPKDRLIPGGEYLAFPAEILFRLFWPDVYTNFQVTRSVERGPKSPLPTKINDGLVLGSAACSSIIATEDYRRLTANGATILTNSASLEIFRGSSLFALDQRGLAVFMATANARPFLQSSNNWSAFGIDQNGHRIAEINPTNYQTVTIAANRHRTPYSLLGEWPALVGGLILLWAWLEPNSNRFFRNRAAASQKHAGRR